MEHSQVPGEYVARVSGLVQMLGGVEGDPEIGVCLCVNGEHYTLDVGSFEVEAGDEGHINLVPGRYVNGTRVIVIQDEDGDGDPPRPPFLAIVVGYDISCDRYLIKFKAESEHVYSEPSGTVHSIYGLVAPMIRAEIRDWNAKVYFSGSNWEANCEASRGVNYRGTWQTSSENYGPPVIIDISKKG